MKIEVRIHQGNGLIFMITDSGFIALTREQIDFLGIDVMLIDGFDIDKYQKHYGKVD